MKRFDRILNYLKLQSINNIQKLFKIVYEGVETMSQVRCPYCGSVQVKAMSNQPKKYPRPLDPIALQEWQKGYDCKKCGNDFVVRPPKPLGFFTKLCGWILLAIIAFFVYAAIFSPNKNTSTTTKQEKQSKPVEVETSRSSIQDPFEKESSKQDQDSLANSTDQNDTLSIKTTIRESNQ
jgi:DNA-directed RNA polymerase subunit RPC12/RpoP